MTTTSKVEVKRQRRRGTNRHFICKDMRCCWTWVWQKKPPNQTPTNRRLTPRAGEAQTIWAENPEQRLKQHKTRQEHKYELHRWDKEPRGNFITHLIPQEKKGTKLTPKLAEDKNRHPTKCTDRAEERLEASCGGVDSGHPPVLQSSGLTFDLSLSPCQDALIVTQCSTSSCHNLHCCICQNPPGFNPSDGIQRDLCADNATVSPLGKGCGSLCIKASPFEPGVNMIIQESVESPESRPFPRNTA